MWSEHKVILAGHASQHMQGIVALWRWRPIRSNARAMDQEGIIQDGVLVIVHAHHVRLDHLIVAPFVRHALIKVRITVGANVKRFPEVVLSSTRHGSKDPHIPVSRV